MASRSPARTTDAAAVTKFGDGGECALDRRGLRACKRQRTDCGGAARLHKSAGFRVCQLRQDEMLAGRVWSLGSVLRLAGCAQEGVLSCLLCGWRGCIWLWSAKRKKKDEASGRQQRDVGGRNSSGNLAAR